MAVVKMIRVVWWTPCQNDQGGIDPPCQNGTAPHRVETPRQRNEETKNKKFWVISLVFDISNIPTLDRTSRAICIGKDLRMYSVECG